MSEAKQQLLDEKALSRMRKATELHAHKAACFDDLLAALKRIMGDLPMRRDWLDPVTEAMAKDAIAKAESK